MMEMIRSWRILPVAAWPRAMMDVMRACISWIKSPKMTSFAKWATAIILIGMLTGAMTVILPPLASIGVVAVISVVLLWAMPELHVVPDKLLRKMFFMMVVAQLCVPAYYAIDTGLLPWISVRRFFSLAVILLFALTVAGSQSARENIADTLRRSRLLAICTIGFLVMIFLSIFTSSNPVASLKELVDTLLNWYVPFFACILVVRTEEDVIFLLKIIAIAAIFDTLAGVLEFFLQRRYFFDIFPRGLLESMLSSNPALASIYSTSSFRNGVYRASSIYITPLAFGELVAMVAPIGAYFFFHSPTTKWRVLGVATVIASVIAMLSTGARGGFIAFLVAMPVMLCLWTIRYSKANPSSLVGAIMGAVFLIGTVTAVGLILSSTRLSNIVLGGGETAASTEARFAQWDMAVPHILSNPVTGHGAGISGDVIGYFSPGSTIPTVDSYLISLLVEVGVPGLLFFFGMIAIGIWIGIRLYLTDSDYRAAVAGALACSLIAFAVYRTVLSQRENHTLLFLFIGVVFVISKLGQERLASKKIEAVRNSHPQHRRSPDFSSKSPAVWR